MDELIQDIVEGLTLELQSEPTFDSSILQNKVKNAYMAVKKARRYPSDYTKNMISRDMENYYINIRDIALYDYNSVGAEYESSHSENSVSRTWVSRDELFCGVLPIARL